MVERDGPKYNSLAPTTCTCFFCDPPEHLRPIPLLREKLMDSEDGSDHDATWADAETRWPGGPDGVARMLHEMAKDGDHLTVKERRACATASLYITTCKESAYLYMLMNQIFTATLPRRDQEPNSAHLLAAKGIEFCEGQNPCEQRGGCMYVGPEDRPESPDA